MKKELEQNRGITLVALIITIIVMLILVAVSVNVLIKSNLIGIAEKTTGKYKTASEEEGKGEAIEIGGKKYASIEEYLQDGGETTFKIEGKTYKVEKDMTWAQWIESEYNTDKYRIEGNTTNGVVLKKDSIDTIKYCPKTTQIALAKDAIIVGQNYTLSTIKLPVYWYLSEAGEYVSATSESDLETALSNKAQMVHCERNIYQSAGSYRSAHREIGSVLPTLQLIEGIIKTDENLISTEQIATPYYKHIDDIEKVNSGESSLLALLTKMGIDTSSKITTNSGSTIDINGYEMIAPFFEIYLTNSQNDRKYEMNGRETIKLSIPSIDSSMEESEILLLCIEPNSNSVNFIEVKSLDTSNKELIVELSKLGVMGVLYKQETLE